MSTDRIEKRVVLQAPRERVWRAVSDSGEFGEWFGARFEGPFEPGRRVVGWIEPTRVDAAVGEAQAEHAGKRIELEVVAVEAPRRLAFRWHPNAVDPARDYTSEPTTLVEFELEEGEEGTVLTIRESGFDAIPLERRAQAFEANEEGWSVQLGVIRVYVTGSG